MSFRIRYEMLLPARLLAVWGIAGGSSASFAPLWTRLTVSMLALILTALTVELTLFAAIGALLFAIDDLAVNLIHFTCGAWHYIAIYSRFSRMFADRLPTPMRPGWLAVLIPAWDEAAVIAPMLRATLERFEHGDYTLFVGLSATIPEPERQSCPWRIREWWRSMWVSTARPPRLTVSSGYLLPSPVMSGDRPHCQGDRPP